MSIKEVRDYHLRMTSDYLSLKETLDKLESEITPEASTAALANIEQIKKQVARVQKGKVSSIVGKNNIRKSFHQYQKKIEKRVYLKKTKKLLVI